MEFYLFDVLPWRLRLLKLVQPSENPTSIRTLYTHGAWIGSVRLIPLEPGAVQQACCHASKISEKYSIHLKFNLTSQILHDDVAESDHLSTAWTAAYLGNLTR